MTGLFGVGRSQGWLTTKIHHLVDGVDDPIGGKANGDSREFWVPLSASWTAACDWPLAESRTAHGSMWPSRWSASALSMYAATWSGAGTDVYQISHRFPSVAAVARPARWSCVSGSRRMPLPSRRTGRGWITFAMCAMKASEAPRAR